MASSFWTSSSSNLAWTQSQFGRLALGFSLSLMKSWGATTLSSGSRSKARLGKSFPQTFLVHCCGKMINSKKWATIDFGQSHANSDQTAKNSRCDVRPLLWGDEGVTI